MKRKSRTLTAMVAVAGVAVFGAVVPCAQASFFTSPQSGGVCNTADNIHGIGASGLRAAMIGWGTTIGQPSPAAATAVGFGYDAGADYPTCQVYKIAADGGTKVFDYRATGSGSCLTILGKDGARSYTPSGEGAITDVSYCGTEDAPTEAQITASEGGPAATPSHPSEAQLMTIPVAQVAIAIHVRVPDGCQVPDSSKRQISRDTAEAAFEGTITTWSQVFGNDMVATTGVPADNTACRAKAFKRVVRLDNSGTTFLLKRYLQGVTDLPGGSSFDWREPSFNGTLANNAWPNDAGGTAVVRGAANGNGSSTDALSALSADGGIGYADVATSRSKDYGWTYVGPGYEPNDQKLWLRVQRVANDTFVSPAISNAESTSGTNLGANCVNVSYSNQPTTNLGQSWADATAVPTPTDYGICGLDYVVTSMWAVDAANGYAPVFAGSANQGEWRGTKDFIRYMVGVIRPGVGPSQLPLNGYAKLPADVNATAKCEVNIMGYYRTTGGSGDPAPATAIPRGACP